jgi:hypothetical protein
VRHLGLSRSEIKAVVEALSRVPRARGVSTPVNTYDEGFGRLQASGFRKLSLSPAAMAKSALHRLQTTQTVPMAAEIGDGNSPLLVGANQWRGELNLAQDHDLIEQGQGQPIEFLLLTAHDELLAIQRGGAVGAEEIERAHGLLGMAFPVFP